MYNGRTELKQVMSVLEVKNLNVSYGASSVLEGVSFSLDKGDALAVIGPNGSGKTTLFKAILGAMPYEGEIKIAPGARIGYVPQKLDLERDLPITVREFLLLRRQAKTAKTHSSEEALRLVGLKEEFLKKKLGELSSGEFQRVLVAFALIDRPELLLFDEPTASVDIAGQETVYELLNRLQKIEGLTLLLISHELSVVYRYANKVLCLNHAQICFGVPYEVLTPQELAKLYGGGTGKFYQHGGH